MDTFVGYCAVEIVDEQSGVTFPMAVMYPALTPGKPERLGPYTWRSRWTPRHKKAYFRW